MPKKILIVDDKEDNRYVLRNFFRLFGIRSDLEVLEAESGQQAVETVTSEKPDLVLMDIKMETDDAGLVATRAIRESDEVKETLIWALTSQAMEAYDGTDSDRDKCLKAGCNDYITKPFDQIELIQRISKVLDLAIPAKTRLKMGIAQ